MGMKINSEFDSHKESIIQKTIVILDDAVFSSINLPTISQNVDEFLTDYLLSLCNIILLGKLTGFQPVRKFPTLYGTRNVQYRQHNSPSLVPTLSHMNPLTPHAEYNRSPVRMLSISILIHAV